MEARVEFRKSRFLWNSASGVATRLLSLTVLVWMHQYLLRRIEPGEYAIYAVVVSLLAFGPILIELTAGGPRRYIIEAYARGDDDRIADILRSVTPLLFGAATLLVGISGLFALRVEQLLTIPAEHVDQARWMVFLVGSTLSLQLAAAPFLVGFHVRQRFVLLNGINLGSELLRIAMLVVLLVGVSPRVLWVVVASATAGVTNIVVQAIVSHRLLPSLRVRFGRIRWDILREQFRFGGWTSLGNFAAMVRQAAPAIVLNKFATPIDVAAFHVGALPFRQLGQLVTRATDPIQPAITTMHALEQHEAMREAYLRGTRLNLWATLLPAALLIAFADELMALYIGDRYAAAAPVLAILFASYPLNASTTLVYRFAIATAQLRVYFLWVLGLHVFLLLLMIYVVAVLEEGATGVAAAFFAVSVAGTAFWRYANRLVGTRLRDFFRQSVIPGTVPFLAGLGVALAWSRSFAPGDWWQLAGGAAVASLVYLVILAGVLRPADRADLGRIAQRLFGRGPRSEG